jgi:putative MATE family efflux protein
MLSRKQGEGDLAGVRRVAWQSVLVVGALSLIAGALALFGAGALLHDVVGAKGQVAAFGERYLRVLLGGSFTIFFLLHLTTIQRALGSSKTPVTLLVVANALNLILAVLLVYGPGAAPPVFAWGPPIARLFHLPRLELMGAAWATLLARALVLLPTAWILVRRFKLFDRPSRTRPDASVVRSLLRVAWPSSAELVVRITAMLITHSLVARAYTSATDQSATTALGIVFRLETMALFVGLGWGSAAQTFVGQNLGAGRADRAKQSGYYAAALNAGMMALLALTYRAFGARIVGFFDDDPTVLRIATSYIDGVSPSYIALGVGIVLGSAIQGAGATRLTFWLDTLVVFGLQVPLSLAVVFGFDAGYERLWLVVAATYTVFAVVYLVAYRRGGFLRTVIA